MEEQKDKDAVIVESRKKSVSTIFIALSWIALIGGFWWSGIIFNFNLYTQMNIEQRILVTLDQTQNILVGIGIAIFFVLLAIFYKNKEK